MVSIMSTLCFISYLKFIPSFRIFLVQGRYIICNYGVAERAMSELQKNERVMEKAQTEVRWVCNRKGNVDETDLHELKYLKLVIRRNSEITPSCTFFAAKNEDVDMTEVFAMSS